jgi:predicted phage tail protein
MNHYLMGHKGDDSHTPTEDADSLCSRAYARIVDLLCEGEIAGLVNGAQSIYLNNIPLVDDNGNANFSSVSWDFRSGTQGQAVLNITAGVEDTTQIGTQLRCNEGVIAAVGDINVNSVLLTLSVGSMIKEDTGNGDIHGTSVTINIDVQSAGTAWQPAGVPSVTISGKTESSYQRDVAFNLPGDGPWNIRVTRITEDSNSAALQNSTYWTALTTVISDKFSYPNSAVIGFSCDASEFSSIPTRAYDLYGKIIQIPANYDPQARSYSGIWDGSFVWAWSDNPAWIMYDLITQPRYGLGDLVDATLVDKWSLYSIAQYCDEGVDDGFGGQEPRFTCNAYIQSQQDAIKTLNDISSNFRAMVFWGSGGVTVSQDSPKPVKYLFTSANVTSSGFSYQGSNRNTRSNTALVAWNDMGNMAQTANEYVSDDDDIAATGALRQVSLQAIGCTSRGQAHRLGKWAIYSALTETDTVIFSTGLEGMIPAPGDIIQTADPFKAGNRFGGRLAAASTAQ